jgi:hypothetical protein
MECIQCDAGGSVTSTGAASQEKLHQCQDSREASKQAVFSAMYLPVLARHLCLLRSSILPSKDDPGYLVKANPLAWTARPLLAREKQSLSMDDSSPRHREQSRISTSCRGCLSNVLHETALLNCSHDAVQLHARYAIGKSYRVARVPGDWHLTCTPRRPVCGRLAKINARGSCSVDQPTFALTSSP